MSTDNKQGQEPYTGVDGQGEDPYVTNIRAKVIAANPGIENNPGLLDEIIVRTVGHFASPKRFPTVVHRRPSSIVVTTYKQLCDGV